MRILHHLLALLALCCCAQRVVEPPGHAAQVVPGRTADTADSASRVRGATAVNASVYEV